MRTVRASVEQGMVAPGIPAGSAPYALYGEAAPAPAVGQVLRKKVHPEDKKVPVKSFMDDLERKVKLKKVMKPKTNKFTGNVRRREAGGSLPVYLQPRDLLTKEETNYRYSGQPTKSCGVCRFFKEPATCQIIAGAIRPVDVCDKFEPVGEGDMVKNVVRAMIAEQDDEEELNGCADDEKDADGNCPDDPMYDPDTAGQYDSDMLSEQAMGTMPSMPGTSAPPTTAPPAFPGSGGMTREAVRATFVPMKFLECKAFRVREAGTKPHRVLFSKHDEARTIRDPEARPKQDWVRKQGMRPREGGPGSGPQPGASIKIDPKKHPGLVGALLQHGSLGPGGKWSPKDVQKRRQAMKDTGRGINAEAGNRPHKVLFKKHEVTPPGFEKVVRKLKKQPGVVNPWAVAYAMKKKGVRPKQGESR